MAYRIEQGEAIDDALRRIAREQVDRAIAGIDDASTGGKETVHDVRKRCKKIRGALRLARPALGDTYAIENAWYRDTARSLSRIRDAHSMIDVFDALLDRFDGPLNAASFAPFRVRLVERADDSGANGEKLADRLEVVRARLAEGGARICDWQLEKRGFGAIRHGLGRTYARGATAMQAACDDPASARFHQWRKRAKYHRYHMRLLWPLWEQPLKARRDEAGALGDLLGADHDLAVLADVLCAVADGPEEREKLEVLIGSMVMRQAALRAAARPLGARLYAERRKAFEKRMARYWQASRRAETAGRA